MEDGEAFWTCLDLGSIDPAQMRGFAESDILGPLYVCVYFLPYECRFGEI